MDFPSPSDLMDNLLTRAADAGVDAAVEAVVSQTLDDRGPSDRGGPFRLPGRFTSHHASATALVGGVPVNILIEDFGAGRFGLSQLSLTSTNARDADRTNARGLLVGLAQRLNGRRTMLEPVSALCVERLFARPLPVPLMLGRSDRITATVLTTDNAAAGLVRLAIVGYSAEQLAALEAAGRIERDVDGPVLLARTETVGAGVTAHPIRFEGRGQDLAVGRIVAASSTPTGDAALTLTPKTGTAQLTAPMSPDQLNDLFRWRDFDVSLPVPAERPLTVYVDNPTGAPIDLSVVVVAYPA